MKINLSINKFLSILIVLIMLLVQFAPIVKAENASCNHEWEGMTNKIHVCDKCGATENHNWDANGKCTVCNAKCSHSWNSVTGKCSICGMSKLIETEEDDENVIKISTEAELRALATSVNGGNDYAGKTIYLTKSIELKEGHWTQIGTETHPFKGIFDGKNYIIRGLNCSSKIKEVTNYGLFGYIENAKILNVRLEDVNIELPKCSRVGGLVGCADMSSIINCSVYGNIEGCSCVGGIVGIAISSDYKADYDIKNCSFYGYIMGEISVGGVVGYLDTMNVINCHVSNAIVGGSSAQNIGGVIGYLEIGSADKMIKIDNCDFYGSVFGKECVGGILGNFMTSTSYWGLLATNLTNRGDVNGNLNVGGIAGNWFVLDDSNIQCKNCVNDGIIRGDNFVAGIMGRVVKVEGLSSEGLFCDLKNVRKVIAKKWDQDGNGIIDLEDLDILTTKINEHDGEIITGRENYKLLDMNYDRKINKEDLEIAIENILEKYLNNLPSEVKHNDILNYENDKEVYVSGVVNSGEVLGAISEICGVTKEIKSEYNDKINGIDVRYEISTTDNKLNLIKGDKITVVATFDGYLSNKNTEMEALSEANKPKLYLTDGIEMTIEDIKYANTLDYNGDGKVNMEDVTYAQKVNAGVIIDTNKERFTNEEILTVQKYLAKIDNKQNTKTTIITYTYEIPANIAFEIEKLKMEFPNKIYIGKDTRTGVQYTEIQNYKEIRIIETIGVDAVLPEITKDSMRIYYKENGSNEEKTSGTITTGNKIYAEITTNLEVVEAPTLKINFDKKEPNDTNYIKEFEWKASTLNNEIYVYTYEYTVQEEDIGVAFVRYGSLLKSKAGNIQGASDYRNTGIYANVSNEARINIYPLTVTNVSNNKYITDETNIVRFAIVLTKGNNYQEASNFGQNSITVTNGEIRNFEQKVLSFTYDNESIEIPLQLYELDVEPAREGTVTVSIPDDTIQVKNSNEKFKGDTCDLLVDGTAPEIESIEILTIDEKPYLEEGDKIFFIVKYNEEIEKTKDDLDKITVKIGEKEETLKSPERITENSKTAEIYKYYVPANTAFSKGDIEIDSLEGKIQDKARNIFDKKDITKEGIANLIVANVQEFTVDSVTPKCTIEPQGVTSIETQTANVNYGTEINASDLFEAPETISYKSESKNLKYQIKFSEEIKEFTSDNIELTNAKIEQLSREEGADYFTLTATATEDETTVTLTIKDVEDLAGNKMSETTKEVVVEENKTVVEDGTLSDIQKSVKTVSPETAKDLSGITVAIKNAVKAVDSTKTDSDIKVKVFEEDGTTIPESNQLATGMVMKVQVGESQEIEYKVVVKGDVNGDGEVEFDDIIRMNYERLHKQNARLTGEYKAAGDIGKTGNVEFDDIIKANYYRLKKLRDL